MRSFPGDHVTIHTFILLLNPQFLEDFSFVCFFGIATHIQILSIIEV